MFKKTSQIQIEIQALRDSNGLVINRIPLVNWKKWEYEQISKWYDL